MHKLNVTSSAIVYPNDKKWLILQESSANMYTFDHHEFWILYYNILYYSCSEHILLYWWNFRCVTISFRSSGFVCQLTNATISDALHCFNRCSHTHTTQLFHIVYFIIIIIFIVILLLYSSLIKKITPKNAFSLFPLGLMALSGHCWIYIYVYILCNVYIRIYSLYRLYSYNIDEQNGAVTSILNQ